MASQSLPLATPNEYLEMEHDSAIKHEFLDGQIVAMSGTSFRHNLIVGNLTQALGRQLKESRCRGLNSDLRVAIPSNRLYCYPDLTIACPPFHLIPGPTDTLTNPVFLIEVLSPSTRSHDRGYKVPLYREIPSLTGYLLVEQHTAHVEHGSRVSRAEWTVTLTSDADAVLELHSLSCRLPVSEIYAGLDSPSL